MTKPLATALSEVRNRDRRIAKLEKQFSALQAENAKLRTCVEELLDFVPYEKPELGPLPNWICKIKARAEAALAKAR